MRLAFLSRLKPESRLALLFGWVFGGLALLVAPPISTCDGPGHFYRAVQIQRGEFRSERLGPACLGGAMPRRYAHFVDTLWEDYWSRQAFGTPASWWRLSTEAAALQGTVPEGFGGAGLYSPANYLGQSAGIGLVALFGRSPLLEHAAGCLLNLASYLLLVVLALEWIPRYERGVLLFATNPLLLLQAASLSTDGVNFAVPLLVVAGVLRLRSGTGEPTGRPLGLLFGLAVLSALLKPIAVIGLFCLLAIPTARFGSLTRRGLWLALTAASVAGCWYVWNAPYFDFENLRWIDPNAPPAAVMKQWARQHPGEFLPLLGAFLKTWWWDFLPGVFGNVGGWVPTWAYGALPWCSIGFGVATLAAPTGQPGRDPAWAFVLGLQCLLFLVGLALVFWVNLGTPGTRVLFGLSGRYLPTAYFLLSFGVAELLGDWLAGPRRLLGCAGLALNAGFLLLVLGAVAARMI